MNVINLSPAGTNSGNIFDRIDIVESILLKLPIKCVCRCKVVRKSWYDLIAGPGFSKKYAKTSPCTWLLSSSSYMGSIYLAANLYLLQTEGIDIVESCFNLKGGSKRDDLEVVDSCNGLCCLIKHHDRSDKNKPPLFQTVIICNPLTGECVTLPTGEYIHMIGARYGFGFSRSTCRYKVVKMGRVLDRYTGQLISTYGHICTLGVDENWREIEDPSFICERFNSAIYSNGGIHCIHGDSIYDFDLDQEKARWIPFPPSLRGIIVNTKLIELDGHLCVVHHINKFQIDIWVMKEYGVVESWTKTVILKEPFSPNNILLAPITRLKDGRLLFRSESLKNLLAYDQKDEKMNVVSCNFISIDFYAFVDILTYVPCFASLKDVIAQGREDTSVNQNQNSS